ncbi:MAG: sugar transferase [Rhodocyclales bacterium]|nr:sugar transferase [Rhodocyclales bacterium]
MKRAYDFLMALLMLILALPLLLLLAVLIRVRLGSPVFFRQLRPGLHGKSFMLCKFRSMSDARNEQGELLPDDIRLGAFGARLRSLSLDELPQLWNVLKGDMSLVGPRPLLMQYLARYSSRQARRHEVRPGITGWAQVNGRNALSWEERLELDVWYVDNRSFLLDIKILVMTARGIFCDKGVSAKGHVTMPEFTGSTQEKP